MASKKVEVTETKDKGLCSNLYGAGGGHGYGGYSSQQCVGYSSGPVAYPPQGYPPAPGGYASHDSYAYQQSYGYPPTSGYGGHHQPGGCPPPYVSPGYGSHHGGGGGMGTMLAGGAATAAAATYGANHLSSHGHASHGLSSYGHHGGYGYGHHGGFKQGKFGKHGYCGRSI